MGAIWSWLMQRSSWEGAAGIGGRVGEQMAYLMVALLLTAAIAGPWGAWLERTGRGTSAVRIVMWVRFLPVFGVLLAVQAWLGNALPWGLPHQIATVVLASGVALGPVLLATRRGVQRMSADARAAAIGLGLSRRQALFHVELACALPELFGGMRAAVRRIMAVVTIAAVIGTGGLGRIIVDGIASGDIAQAGGGAVAVSLLALLIDSVIAVVQRVIVSPGVAGRVPVATRMRIPTARPVLDPMVADDVEGLGMTDFDEPAEEVEAAPESVGFAPLYPLSDSKGGGLPADRGSQGAVIAARDGDGA